jgi:hypothetical protein
MHVAVLQLFVELCGRFAVQDFEARLRAALVVGIYMFIALGGSLGEPYVDFAR